MRTDYTGGQKLKTWTLLKRDLFFYLPISFIIELWIIFFVITAIAVDDPETPEDETLSSEDERGLIFGFCAVTAAFVGAVAWRFKRWSSFVKGGVEVPGNVSKLMMVSGPYSAYKVTVTYRLDGNEVVSSRHMEGLFPKFKRNIREGQEVSLLVNPAKPGRFVILDLYMNTMP